MGAALGLALGLSVGSGAGGPETQPLNITASAEVTAMIKPERCQRRMRCMSAFRSARLRHQSTTRPPNALERQASELVLLLSAIDRLSTLDRVSALDRFSALDRLTVLGIFILRPAISTLVDAGLGRFVGG